METNLRYKEQEFAREDSLVIKRKFLINESLNATDVWRSRFEEKKLICDF